VSYVDAVRAMANVMTGTERAHGVLQPHEEEVLAMFKARPPKLPAGLIAKHAPREGAKWELEGVEISVVPDVLLVGDHAGGAMKLFCAKEALASGLGPTMAALLHYYQAQIAHAPNARPEHAMIYDVRRRKLHKPSTNVESVLRRARAACRITRDVWARL
jgi:hypothetical protein